MPIHKAMYQFRDNGVHADRYTVRAARCDHRRSADEIYRTLERITAPLT